MSGNPTEASLNYIQTVAQMALTLPAGDAEAVLAEIGRTHALMPILDPTRYKQIMGNINGHERVVRAFMKFRAVVAELAGEKSTP